jgi:hypothetical protein
MNTWKLTTIGISLVAVTALATGLTTAHLMRPAERAEILPTLPASPIPATPRVLPPVRTAPANRAMVVSRHASARVATAAPASVPAIAAEPPEPGPVSASPVGTVRTAGAPAPVAADCSTTGNRVLRAAKPGLLGGLLGAGLGAATGAIANGGKGAGKGAAIGGITGALVGGAYGAYKTKQECGTVLGGSGLFGDSTGPAAAPDAPGPALQPGGDGITVYGAR